VPYLSALERPRKGAIQIHVYFYLTFSGLWS